MASMVMACSRTYPARTYSNTRGEGGAGFYTRLIKDSSQTLTAGHDRIALELLHRAAAVAPQREDIVANYRALQAWVRRKSTVPLESTHEDGDMGEASIAGATRTLDPWHAGPML
ncbi:hypothetical protein IHE31_13065 [Mycetohabitans rhizoxinica]|uniref:hypothetical protein n=1 Tax=Mycetohabitans rhizoxinica TaxID=412963 RepID=UPI0030CF6308